MTCDISLYFPSVYVASGLSRSKRIRLDSINPKGKTILSYFFLLKTLNLCKIGVARLCRYF